MSVGGRVQIFSLTHTLRENYLYRTLVLSNSRMPFTSFTSVQSLHKTWSGLEGDSLSGISTFHLIPNWCLLGQKDGKKKKKGFMKESYHILTWHGDKEKSPVNILLCGHVWSPRFCSPLYLEIKVNLTYFCLPHFTRVKNALLVKQRSECPCSGSERQCSGFLSKA